MWESGGPTPPLFVTDRGIHTYLHAYLIYLLQHANRVYRQHLFALESVLQPCIAKDRMMDGANTSNPREFLKKKIQIGGSESGLINYSAKQTVFHHDDISEEKRARKADVRRWAKQDKLIEKHSSWNKSTHPNNPLMERRTMENFVKDRCTVLLAKSL